MELRLATFNLQNLGIRPGEDSDALRTWLPLHAESLRTTLRRLDADAVAFQEVLDLSLLEELVRGLGYRHLVASLPSPSPLRIGVFSRHPLRSLGPVAAATEWAAADPKTGIEVSIRGPFSRSALEVVWEAPGGDIALLVNHWKSKIPSLPRGAGWSSLGQVGEGRLLSEIKRLAQAVELRKAVDHRLEQDPLLPLAVLGDFNDGLDSEGLRILRGDARSARSADLLSRELFACELSIPESSRYTALYRGRREMLDHILISPQLKARYLGATILNEEVVEEPEIPPESSRAGSQWEPDPCVPQSDHAPLVAVFRL